MSARIQIIVGPDLGRVFVLEAGSTLEIGRSLSTPTQLTDAAVSRVHCRIEFDGASATLHNLSSKGTQVNGTVATMQQLHHGDVVRIGHTEFRFSLDSLGEAETLYQPGAPDLPTRNDRNLPPAS